MPAERIRGWLDRFEHRHGAMTATSDTGAVRFTAADGAVARVRLAGGAATPDRAGVERSAAAFDTFGLVLVRRGGFAVGWVDAGRLSASRCGSRYVQGRTKAGGWSQQRYARRRAHQADAVARQAADAVGAVLPRKGVSLVGGGDRPLVRQVLDLCRRPDDALVDRWLDVPDPRRQVLLGAVEQARAARIDLNSLA